MNKPVSIGILGTANIARRALLEPAKKLSCAFAVAARRRERAEAFAASHGIARVFPDYTALLESDAVGAVYIQGNRMKLFFP
uniref:Oxidoreductase family, NAD-binding Rossmann fold n=1 Tax=Candidatus Kentrum sp. UNK TaxID=2126344 RepID=A0A451AXT2_9GAMM|nr:MAG: Oxidoreductase family, NAD-binding Rossmann fold [Candidatus Kentron sp. UNK]VFK70833.1 MAG: Oxidoreductase family, NAD-binding Rossmann fold [Candidatus Kentron sp. UNK]